MKRVVKIHDLAGDFAENKDVARQVRIETIMPALSRNAEVVIDFSSVSGATQSFVHALIAEPIREFREVAFANLYFKNTTESVKKIIETVYKYMQESLE